MNFNIVTIFPELIDSYINHGLLAKANEGGLISVNTWNPRDFSEDKNRRIDDKPFGGGQGMLFQAPCNVGSNGLSIKAKLAPIKLATLPATSISAPGELPKLSPKYCWKRDKILT